MTGNQVSGRVRAIRAASITAPADWSGWTVSPSDPDIPYSFKVADGVFRLSIANGLALIFR